MIPSAPFPPDGAIVPPLPTCWTPERRDIRVWLASNAPSLGELYLGAVTMLYDTPVPAYVRVTANVSELAVCRIVAAVARSGARVHGGNECVRVEPLNGAGLGNAWDGLMFVKGHAGNNAGELWAALLHERWERRIGEK
jgi:hypothetical protein